MLWSCCFKLETSVPPTKKKIANIFGNVVEILPHVFVTSCHFPSNFSRLTQEARLREAVLTEAALVSELFFGGGLIESLRGKHKMSSSFPMWDGGFEGRVGKDDAKKF